MLIIAQICAVIFPDRNLRGRGSGPTEAGSALGPDWHEGIVLKGAEQVRYYIYTFVTECVFPTAKA